MSHLKVVHIGDGLADLLPYVLDPHGPGSRASILKDPKTREARDAKRQKGVFYTPSDVANYMARAVLNDLEETEPACCR